MTKALVIDDSSTLRTRIVELLEGRGIEVLAAESGEEALALAASTDKIELMIVDYNMPEMDGLTAIEQLRQVPSTAQARTLMCTTEVDPALKVRAKQLGVLAWIVKPISPEAFLSAIDKMRKAVG